MDDAAKVFDHGGNFGPQGGIVALKRRIQAHEDTLHCLRAQHVTGGAPFLPLQDAVN